MARRLQTRLLTDHQASLGATLVALEARKRHGAAGAGPSRRETNCREAGGFCARRLDKVAGVRSNGRSARIQVLVAEQAARRGAGIGVVDVCTAAVAALPVGGAGLSGMSRTAASHPLRSTDGISEQLEELQLTLGEGPCVDAFLHGSAVLTPDLLTGELRHRWAVFADAAMEAGARALFALPLRMGAISPGVLDLYADVPTVLDTEEPADALAFVDLATLLLLDARIEETGAPIGGPLPDRGFEDLGAYRAEIDQATGILTVQLGVGIDEAFVRLRAHAYMQGRRLADVAADVVDHRLRFSPDTEPERTDEET